MAKKRTYSKEYYEGLAPFNPIYNKRGVETMGFVIGFARDYYTLWHAVQKDDCITYDYRHNITKDEAYAKSLPLPYDEDLRGVTKRSFSRIVRILVPGVFNYGKYFGRNISESEDIEYMKWYLRTMYDPENRENLIARIMELDPDLILWYPDKENNPELYEWRSRSEKSDADKFEERMRSSEPLTIPINEVNTDGIMVYRVGDGQFFFRFPYKGYAGNYYRRPYGLVLNPKNGKPTITKGKGYTVTISKMKLDNHYESPDGYTYNGLIGFVEDFTINGMPEKKRKSRKTAK